MQTLPDMEKDTRIRRLLGTRAEGSRTLRVFSAGCLRLSQERPRHRFAIDSFRRLPCQEREGLDPNPGFGVRLEQCSSEDYAVVALAVRFALKRVAKSSPDVPAPGLRLKRA